MATARQNINKQRENIIAALGELYPCPEGYIDPVRGIIQQVPNNKLDDLTNELIAAIKTDAANYHEASSSRRRL